MKRFLIVISVVVLLGISIFACEYGNRYASWAGLSRADLIDKTYSYMERYDVSGHSACLYVVACTEDDTAFLSIVPNIDDLDIAALKKRIWSRRFDATCTGRTANIGLHLIPTTTDTVPRFDSVTHARWSFYHDRFLPWHGRFQSGAFSLEAWQRCTAEFALP